MYLSNKSFAADALFSPNFLNHTFTGLWNILRIEVKNFVDVEGVLYHFLSDSHVDRICMHVCFLNKILTINFPNLVSQIFSMDISTTKYWNIHNKVVELVFLVAGFHGPDPGAQIRHSGHGRKPQSGG